MMARAALDTVEELLYREAALLDAQDWDGWLALFAADCVYWAPMWTSDRTVTRDPLTEVSHMYFPVRAGLEERVWRIRSGLSAASTPVPRTLHSLTNIRVASADQHRINAGCNWSNAIFDLRTRNTTVLHGRAEYSLVRSGNDWLISSKKTVLHSDYLTTHLDIYSL
jgi:3-phenylpropionate/cinnamic acid dioxygenase small subunit